ncbi:ead/Ea22-like family protein [Cronobacter sakazakii]|nr:ead/Ea22-like family protein [Cronobacter sakazakii]
MNTAKLKAAAEKARWGDWAAYKPHSGARGYEVRVGIEAVAQHCLKDDAAFIAEASPKAVLELIAALEAAEKRIAELEQALSAAENNEIDARCHVAELEKRVGELEREREALEAVTLAMRDEMRMAGINLETGGEA